jgi:outer membrane murein-binding lipoprotein Lpp
MKIFRVIAVVFGILLLSGCGDQVWCGDNGCGASREANHLSPIN